MKRGLEFSFAWLFAIIAGAVIIFLAIYATTNIVITERTASDAQIAKQIGILLNPIETSLESAKIAQINFQSETRFFNTCSTSGNFGRQGISASASSGLGSKFQKPETTSIFFNKYIFSHSTLEGKEIYLFSKPFNMPFKVADMIYAWTDKYCFINPFNDIKIELENLKPKNIIIKDAIESCPASSIVVCFDSRDDDCNIKVSSASKTVEKSLATVKYQDDLIYGAIFADPGIYDCQVSRLLKRTSELASLYAAKTELLSTKGCSSNLQDDLLAYSNLVNNESLSSIKLSSDNLKGRNRNLVCKLF